MITKKSAEEYLAERNAVAEKVSAVHTSIFNIENVIRKSAEQEIATLTASLRAEADALSEKRQELHQLYETTLASEKKAKWNTRVPSTSEEFKEWLETSPYQKE